MWPEPKDLAFVVAAVVAGLFSYIVSLNSKDSAITDIRVKWLEELKEETAQLISYFYAQRRCKRAISINLEKLTGARREGLSEETKNGFREEVKREKDIKRQNHRELVKRWHKLKIELNSRDECFAMLLKHISKLVSYMEIGDSKYDKDVAYRARWKNRHITKLSRIAYKNEWERIKQGDAKIAASRKRAYWYITGLVFLYSVYIFVHAAFLSSDAKGGVFFMIFG